MASLKEVKNRITSVNNTRKITSAMKMVASSKLHKAQQAIENMLPYEQQLNAILTGFLSTERPDSPYVVERPVKRVALVVFASNSSLCGGFNANVIKKLNHLLADYRKQGLEVNVYTVGRKVADAVRKMDVVSDGNDYAHLADKPNYADAVGLASLLMERFVKGELDRIELVYNHFKSTASQVLLHETFLPLQLKEPEEGTHAAEVDYIVEPSKAEVLTALIPKVLKLHVFTAALDSNASEHAARTIAMQVATDNADELLQDLTLQYNKTRQQAITAELLDIVGGSMK